MAIKPGGQGPFSLQGKVAVVTGGASGIGAATVRRLAADGATVVVGYNTGAARAAALISALPGSGHIALPMPATDSVALEAAAAEVRARLGRADVLVNCAGFTKPVPHKDFAALDDALFDKVLITNVRGPFATIRAFEPLLRASGDAVVVNISSVAGITGLGSSIAYAASKAALDTMAMSLARVLAPEIRIIGISPSAVVTDFVEGRGRAQVEKLAEAVPLRVVTEADDVAMAVMAAVTHLRHTTGSLIVVDAGRKL